MHRGRSILAYLANSVPREAKAHSQHRSADSPAGSSPLQQELELTQPAVRLRPAVSIELPDVSDLSNLVEVQVGDDQLVAIARPLREKLSPRIAEITLPIELADIPRLFVADAIDRPDEERIRHGVSRLLELPEVLREPGHRR